MQAFTLFRPSDLASAGRVVAADTAFIAGGTDLIQLMRLQAERPRQLVDLAIIGRKAGLDRIEAGPSGLRIGALATMANVAADPSVQRGWPIISEALLSAASPQIRNMGTIGGNLLQRTRCPYFRAAAGPCNKRIPNSGCPAIAGENRDLAILGTSSHCIATMPSDLPVALTALGADIEIRDPDGTIRRVPLSGFYREPGNMPHLDTVLAPGAIITAILVPASPLGSRSAYVKIRDRQSFQFAVVSIAARLHVQDGTIQDVRIAFGGVGTVPWRTLAVEQALHGKPANEASFQKAAALATQGATVSRQNDFKAMLMPRLVVRVLQTLSA